MRLFATLFTATLLWQTILAVKTTFNDDGTISTTKDYQASYPVSVTAPEPGKAEPLPRDLTKTANTSF
jgi:hypothetical protein